MGNLSDVVFCLQGTPLYMSPELIAGQPYTYASDVWALGLSLIHI